MQPRAPEPHVWATYWTSVYARLERRVGWVLFSIGAIVLLGYWAWNALAELFEDTSVPVAVRYAAVALALGLIVLLVSVIREKWFVNRRERYEEVDR